MGRTLTDGELEILVELSADAEEQGDGETEDVQAIVNAEWDARYHYELSVRAAIEQTLSGEEEPF